QGCACASTSVKPRRAPSRPQLPWSISGTGSRSLLTDMTPASPDAIPEERRPFLLGLAYRILGSYSDAEDAVQDTYLKWNSLDSKDIDNPAAWLTTVCTRHCIDLLRAAKRSRTDYVGSWLPEPIQMAGPDTPESEAELASSLSMAFLLTLERLAPKERAAY